MRLLGLIVYCVGFFWIFTVIAAERYLACKDNSIPVVFDGHLCTGGCVLISSLPEAGAN